jgi:hypothetical protein
MKIMGERRSPNSDLWSMVIENVEELLVKEAFDIKDISQIVDCYYKLQVVQSEHQQNIAKYLISTGFTVADMTQDLTLNEFLRLFRGIFNQNNIPVDNQEYSAIFNLYADSVKAWEHKLSLSSWLTVIETCRHAGDGLGTLLDSSLKKFHAEYNLDELFSTESSSSSQS